jgi:ribosomal protein L19E
MNQSKETTRLLEGKLRLPIHINYISQYILKLPIRETREVLNKMIEEGKIVESRYSSGYYVLKSQE